MRFSVACLRSAWVDTDVSNSLLETSRSTLRTNGISRR
jgi:hypothetical protein